MLHFFTLKKKLNRDYGNNQSINRLGKLKTEHVNKSEIKYEISDVIYNF